MLQRWGPIPLIVYSILLTAKVIENPLIMSPEMSPSLVLALHLAATPFEEIGKRGNTVNTSKNKDDKTYLKEGRTEAEQHFLEL